MSRTIVLDANVLYSARLRDLWMELGVAGLVNPVWTTRIEAEWIAAALRARPELEGHLRRTASIMRLVLPEALVADDPSIAASVTLPDADDTHVVAAALKSGAEAIVTFNVADFPAQVLQPLGIEAITPDVLFVRMASEDEEGFLAAAAGVRARLRAPPVDATGYSTGLARAGCPAIAAWLGERVGRF